jgi:hypothetical protein
MKSDEGVGTTGREQQDHHDNAGLGGKAKKRMQHRQRFSFIISGTSASGHLLRIADHLAAAKQNAAPILGRNLRRAWR